MKRWDCRISVIRDTIVEAEGPDQARAGALEWFFSECLHVIDERDVFVELLDGEE